MGPSAIQRRAPLTTLPTCGISTAISSASETTNSHGAAFSHQSMRTWKAINAATNAMPIHIACLKTK